MQFLSVSINNNDLKVNLAAKSFLRRYGMNSYSVHIMNQRDGGKQQETIQI